MLEYWRYPDLNNPLSRISLDPHTCFGKPCIRGTRIWVSLLLDVLASGSSMEQLLDSYRQLKREDVLAAIAYGAEMSRERFFSLEALFAAPAGALPGLYPREPIAVSSRQFLINLRRLPK